MIPFNVDEIVAEIGSNGSTSKRLTVMRWNGNEPKIDVRAWRIDAQGNEIPGKGLTLTMDEAQALAAALTEYLQREA